jgi:predicted O-linked N-acetylglucosamine transferase (SPINDLY family)
VTAAAPASSALQGLQAAMYHHERGAWPEAEQHYALALASHPADGQVLHMAGVLALQRGDFKLAAERLQRSLDSGVQHAGTWLLRGRALKGLGDLSGAVTAYREAIARDPGLVDAHTCLGVALGNQGLWTQAADASRAALRLRPGAIDALVNLGNAQLKLGQPEEALRQFEKAYKQGGALSPLLYNHGLALRALGRNDEAAAKFQEALDADPDHLEACYNLANTLVDLGQHWEALRGFQHVIARCGEGYEALREDAVTGSIGPLVWTAAYDDARPLLDAALARQPRNIRLREYQLVPLPYRETSRQAVAGMYAEYQSLLPVFEKLRHDPPRAGDDSRKLRIGFISGDLRDHSMAFFLEPLFAHYDRDRFEFTAYCTNHADDAVTGRLRALLCGWVDARELDDNALAREIKARGTDILIDLSGRTRGNRLGVFSRQAAPLQMAYLGYPTYTGVPEIACRITDAAIDPDAGDLPQERALHLPRTQFCYRPPADAPAAPARQMRQPGDVRLASFNQVPKLSPALLDAWVRILNELPLATLTIKAHALDQPEQRERLGRHFERAGLGPDRVILRDSQASRADHLRMYADMDIALDSFPYNGATTTCEALWMGVPVVTWSGETHASRMGMSILGELGLAELIATGADDYVGRVVKLARDPKQLLALQDGLRWRCNGSRLRDEAGFARDFEQLLRAAWARLAAGNR